MNFSGENLRQGYSQTIDHSKRYGCLLFLLEIFGGMYGSSSTIVKRLCAEDRAEAKNQELTASDPDTTNVQLEPKQG